MILDQIKMFCFRPNSNRTKSKNFAFVPIISFDIETFVLSFRYRWHYYSPPSSPPGDCVVYPPPLLRAEDTLAGRRVERGGGGVNILEDARYSSVLYLYRILFGTAPCSLIVEKFWQWSSLTMGQSTWFGENCKKFTLLIACPLISGPFRKSLIQDFPQSCMSAIVPYLPTE